MGTTAGPSVPPRATTTASTTVTTARATAATSGGTVATVISAIVDLQTSNPSTGRGRPDRAVTLRTFLASLSGIALAAAAGAAASALAGCGGNDEVQTVTVEREVTVVKASPSRKEPRQKSPPPRTTPPAFVDCDPNIQAKAETTTCPFAENVFWAYWTSGESSSPLQVWSPATKSNFTTTCESDGIQVTCTTSDNAVARFSQTALEQYSQDQADAYASSHDLGPDPYGGLPSTEPPSSGGEEAGGDRNCQGYDPCIAPGPDVDCAGGSGDGPRYADGPVYVSGYDPYGLDSNHDGVGCEY